MLEKLQKDFKLLTLSPGYKWIATAVVFAIILSAALYVKDEVRPFDTKTYTASADELGEMNKDSTPVAIYDLELRDDYDYDDDKIHELYGENWAWRDDADEIEEGFEELGLKYISGKYLSGKIKNNCDFPVDVSVTVQLLDDKNDVVGEAVKSGPWYWWAGEEDLRHDKEMSPNRVYDFLPSFSSDKTLTATHYKIKEIYAEKVGGANGGFKRPTPIYIIILWIILQLGLPVLAYLLFDKWSSVRRKCYSCIVDRNITSLDEIAAFAGVPYEKVHATIHSMIQQGYFGNIRVDEVGRKIVSVTNKSVMVTVTCPACGASSQINAFEGGTCEYCGTKINAPSNHKK